MGGTPPLSTSHQQHGPPTPVGTPLPEDARVAADRTQRARKAQQPANLAAVVEISDGEDQPATQSKPTFDAGSRSGSDSHSDNDGSNTEGASAPSEAQTEAVRYILACPPKQYRKILKVGPAGDDARGDKEQLVNAFRRLGCLIHPDFNQTKGADKGFKVSLEQACNNVVLRN